MADAVEEPKKLEGREASLANLIPYKPGQSGNPTGKRADGSNPFRCDSNFRTFLRGVEKELKSGTTKERLQWIMEKLFSEAMRGNVKAINTLLDRAYGKAEQKIDIGSQGGNIVINLITGVDEPKAGPLPDAIDVSATVLPPPPTKATPEANTEVVKPTSDAIDSRFIE